MTHPAWTRPGLVETIVIEPSPICNQVVVPNP
jgi:hypothetical protein